MPDLTITGAVAGQPVSDAAAVSPFAAALRGLVFKPTLNRAGPPLTGFHP